MLRVVGTIGTSGYANSRDSKFGRDLFRKLFHHLKSRGTGVCKIAGNIEYNLAAKNPATRISHHQHLDE